MSSCGTYVVVDMFWYITWGSHYWFRALERAHPDGEVDPWSMNNYLPVAHFTGTSKVHLHCGTNMLTINHGMDLCHGALSIPSG